jgi:Spy/CpxP family protein refolding chaperone
MNRKIELLLTIILFGSVVAAQQQLQTPNQPPRNAPSQPTAPAPPTAAPDSQDLPEVPPVPEFAQRPQGQQPQPAMPGQPAMPTRPVPNIPAVPNIPNVPPIDPLGDVMFPPDLILGHSRELMLSAEQKSFMRGEIQKTTTRFNELQWALHDAMEELHQTLESSSVNDQQALALLDKVLDIEREIKRLHFGMGIRLKNKLTAEQQAKLQSIRMGRPWAVGQKPVDNP